MATDKFVHTLPDGRLEVTPFRNYEIEKLEAIKNWIACFVSMRKFTNLCTVCFLFTLFADLPRRYPVALFVSFFSLSIFFEYQLSLYFARCYARAVANNQDCKYTKESDE